MSCRGDIEYLCECDCESRMGKLYRVVKEEKWVILIHLRAQCINLSMY